MLLMLPRSVLVFIYLPLFVTAAPNHRRNDDDLYGGAEAGSSPMYYAQTTTPSSNGIAPEVTASSKLQLPNFSPYPTAEGTIQEGAGISNGGYEFGSSSIARYPLYNSTVPYGSASAYFPSTVSSPDVALPTYGPKQSGALSMPGSSLACPQGPGYGVITSTTIFTEFQTSTTVVTSTSMVMTTSTITAYITSAASPNGQCTGSPNQGQGGGLGPSNENPDYNPATEAVSQGVPNGNLQGTTYPNDAVPTFGGDGATMPDVAPAITSPVQTQPIITGGYFPSQTGYGSGGLPFPSAAVPASQAYGNYSVPPFDDSSVSQASGLASLGQGGQQPYMSLGGGDSAPTEFPMTGGLPGATNPIPATDLGPIPTQQQPGSSYNIPNTDMTVPSLLSNPEYPIETQVANPAISTGANSYESGYEGPGLQLPSTIPPFQNMSSAAPQPMTSTPIQPYPGYTDGPGSAGYSFPGTGITKTMISSHDVIPMPATTAGPSFGNGTYNPGSGYEMVSHSHKTSKKCKTGNMTKPHDHGAHSTILITSISNPPFIPSLSDQPQYTNVPILPASSEIPLPYANSSLPSLPQTSFPPLNTSIPPNSLPPTQPSSIPPAQSVCTPSTSTVTAANFQQYPSGSPLPVPYLGLNFTTFTPFGSSPYSQLVSSSLPHMISSPNLPPLGVSAPATLPPGSSRTTFTLLSLLLSCYPHPGNAFCTVNIAGVAAPSLTTGGAAAAGIAYMSINVPPDVSAWAGNGMEVAGEGLLRPAVNGSAASSASGGSGAVPAMSADTGDTGAIPSAALEPQQGTGAGEGEYGTSPAVQATTLPPTTPLPSQAPAGLEPEVGPEAGGEDYGTSPAVQATTLPPTTPLPSQAPAAAPLSSSSSPPPSIPSLQPAPILPSPSPSPLSPSPASPSIPPGFIAGTNGGLVPIGDGFGVGVPVAFTGQAWTRLQSVSFVAVVGGPEQEGGGKTGVGVDEVVYVVGVECT